MNGFRDFVGDSRELIKKTCLIKVVINFQVSADMLFYLVENTVLLQMEDNIFARTTSTNERFSDISPSITMRSRNSKFSANFKAHSTACFTVCKYGTYKA